MTATPPLWLSLHLSRRDQALLELTAKQAGVPTHEWITRLIRDRLHHAQQDLPLDVDPGRIDP